MNEASQDGAGKANNSARKLVFISYSSRDREPAERLVAEIEAIGIPCWMAPRDVPSGSNYGKEILDALEAAEIFAVLLSTNSNNSVHVANEIERAANYRKMIVPLRLENVKPSREIELHISARQWVDLFEGPHEREQNMRRFLNVLRDVLRAWIVPDLPTLLSAKAEAAMPPAPPPPPQPKPALRKTILEAVDKAGADRRQAAGIALYRAHGESLIPELCAMMLDESVSNHQKPALYEMLGICSAQPSARQHSGLVFSAMLERMQLGGYHLVQAVGVIGKLPLSREEKWRGLFEMFPVVHLQDGYILLTLLCQIVPSDQREEFCRGVTEVLAVPNPALQVTAIECIRKLGYKAAAPELRDLVQMSSSPDVTRTAVECLASWGDAASAPVLRQLLIDCNDGYIWPILAISLYKIEGPAVSSFLVDRFRSVIEVIQWDTLRYGDAWDALKASNSRLLIDALQRIAKNAVSDDMRKLASQRLSELSPS